MHLKYMRYVHTGNMHINSAYAFIYLPYHIYLAALRPVAFCKRSFASYIIITAPYKGAVPTQNPDMLVLDLSTSTGMHNIYRIHKTDYRHFNLFITL